MFLIVWRIQKKDTNISKRNVDTPVFSIVSISDIDQIMHAGFPIVREAGSLSAVTFVVHGGARVETLRTLNGDLTGLGGGYCSLSCGALD